MCLKKKTELNATVCRYFSNKHIRQTPWPLVSERLQTIPIHSKKISLLRNKKINMMNMKLI